MANYVQALLFGYFTGCIGTCRSNAVSTCVTLTLTGMDQPQDSKASAMFTVSPALNPFKMTIVRAAAYGLEGRMEYASEKKVTMAGQSRCLSPG